MLIGELRSHMASQPKNQNIKQKQYCKKFNKDFKNGPHQKKKKKERKKEKIFKEKKEREKEIPGSESVLSLFMV